MSFLAVLLFTVYTFAGCRSPQTSVPHVSATPTSRLQPTASRVPSITVEAASVATLSPQESEAYVEALLEDNGRCPLPCVWGITPGKTKYEDAKQFFGSLGWKGSEAQGSYWSGKDMQSFPISFQIGAHPEGDIVGKLSFSISGNGFQDKVGYYSFGNMLEMLGKPSQVLVFVGASPGSLEPEETSFELLLHYPDRNALLQYTGTAVRDGDSYRICPSQPNADSTEVNPRSGNVSIFVGEGTEGRTPQELVRPFWVLPDYYISVDKAFGMSVDQFYETVSQSNGNACFESPLAVWKR